MFSILSSYMSVFFSQSPLFFAFSTPHFFLVCLFSVFIYPRDGARIHIPRFFPDVSIPVSCVAFFFPPLHGPPLPPSPSGRWLFPLPKKVFPTDSQSPMPQVLFAVAFRNISFSMFCLSLTLPPPPTIMKGLWRLVISSSLLI